MCWYVDDGSGPSKEHSLPVAGPVYQEGLVIFGVRVVLCAGARGGSHSFGSGQPLKNILDFFKRYIIINVNKI